MTGHWGETWREPVTRVLHDLEQEYKGASDVLSEDDMLGIVRGHVASIWTEAGMTDVGHDDITELTDVLNATVAEREEETRAERLFREHGIA